MRALSRDVLFGVAWLGIGVAALVNLEHAQDARWGGDLGPLFLPRVALWTLLVMAAGWLVAGLSPSTRRRGPDPGARRPPDEAWTCQGPAHFAGTMALYALVLLPALGFLWASLVFALWWTMVLLRVQESTSVRQVLTGFAATFVFTVGLHFAFVRLLRVALP